MQNSPPFFLLLLVTVGILGLASVIAGLRLRRSPPSRAVVFVALLPAVVMLGLFSSLAVHLHESLGGWPTSIGLRGFPDPLVTHAGLAVGTFSILHLATLLAWPSALLVLGFVRRWRGGVFYLGIYALSCFLCFGAMSLAPRQYLVWWWD